MSFLKKLFSKKKSKKASKPKDHRTIAYRQWIILLIFAAIALVGVLALNFQFFLSVKNETFNENEPFVAMRSQRYQNWTALENVLMAGQMRSDTTKSILLDQPNIAIPNLQ